MDTETQARPPFGRLLRLRPLLKKYGPSRATLYKMIEKGTWPKPVRLGDTRTAAWVESECDAAAEKWIAARDEDHSKAGAK